MHATRFDRISRWLDQWRGRARSTSQDATPTPALETGARTVPELLYVQTFQVGAIAQEEGTGGRYTLTLEGGHGQTVYFSDRPDRVVGATPTQEFLDRLGFPDDDPPNAALVVETAPGETDVAVVELFSPVYDTATGGVTYQVEVLANWQDELGVGFHEAPTDLAALAPSFGAAHLFIDGLLDCPSGLDIYCEPASGEVNRVLVMPDMDFCADLRPYPFGSAFQPYCFPCAVPTKSENGFPLGDWRDIRRHVGDECNRRFPDECKGDCFPAGWCQPHPSMKQDCPS